MNIARGSTGYIPYWQRTMTQSEREIISATASLARRMNISIISRMASRFLLCGIVFSVIVIILGKFIAIPTTSIVAGILLTSLFAGIIRGIVMRISTAEAAMKADTKLGIKERLSSAMELLKNENRSQMAELQLADAASYARSLDPKSICPRRFPAITRILPVALLLLIATIYFLAPYGQAGQIPTNVSQSIKEAGAGIENTAKVLNENPMSDKIAELASRMEALGSDLKDKSITKKEALKNISKLTQEVEALEMMNEVAEKLEGDMTPEQKRLLNELLKKLIDNLRDLPELSEFSKKLSEIQQDNLSDEALRKLAAALEQMGLGASDTEALKKMAEQLAKSKRMIGQSRAGMSRQSKDAGESDPTDTQAEDESGLMGSGTPGKKTAAEMKEKINLDPDRPIPSGQGYDSELSGQLSDDGKAVTTERELEPEAGKASVSYEKIYAEYRNAADDAISKPEIPWTYREHVKNYFDAIKPEADH